MLVYLDYTVNRLEDDIDVTDFNFTWEAVELGVDYLVIHCNFTNVFAISQDVKFDKLILHFKRIPEFFN